MPQKIDTVELINSKLEELKAKRLVLDSQIEALGNACKVFESGEVPKRRAPVATAGGVRKSRVVDKRAREKTISFMYARKRPVTPENVAEKFGIKYSAANQRLHTLVHDGLAQRVGKGQYVLANPDAMRTEILDESEAAS